MLYWTCPNELQCGSQGHSIQLLGSGSTTTIGLDKKQNNFLLGDICKYQVQAPNVLSAIGDSISVKIESLSNAEGWAFLGNIFTNITQ
jgi:hypothetical protein